MLPVLIQLFDIAPETGFPRRLAAQRLHKWKALLFSSTFAVKTMWGTYIIPSHSSLR